MKLYIKANSEKPILDSVHTDWEELEDESGIKFIVYSDDHEVLFEEIFEYDVVDSDAIYSSAIELATIALSQKYELSENAIEDLHGPYGV